MKRRNTVRGGEGGKQGGGNNRNHNHNKKTKKQHPTPPVIGTVATRTRHHKKEKAAKWQHPVSILINIVSYADPELVRDLCGVSKQFRDIIYHNPGMENKIVPLIWIRPSEEEQNDKGRLHRLLQQLYVQRDRLQRHREVKIIAGHKFLFTNGHRNWREEIKKVVATQLHFEGVVSLDMSSPITTSTIDYLPRYLTIALAIILPNLRKINLSNATMNGPFTLDCFLKNCFYLETITWNNIEYQSEVSLSGYQLRNGKTLKEIYMDNSVFFTGYSDKLSDLENDQYSDCFLFHHCSSTVLERVSIKNAKHREYIYTATILPQNALIKFVRKSPPSLRWFRSDLSSENMTMLRSERPEIELVN